MGKKDDAKQEKNNYILKKIKTSIRLNKKHANI